MADSARTPPPAAATREGVSPREGVVDMDERRRLAAEAEAREREASLRADPSVGPVGEPPRAVAERDAMGRPIVRDTPVRTDAPVRTNEQALAQARGDIVRDDTVRGDVRPADDPLARTPPATPPNYDDDVRYAEREGSPGYGEARDPDQLQDEIELLQNRMQERLTGITSAFEPQNLIAAATGTKNPDVFTTVDTVVDAARRNPLPAALIAAGMAGLFLNGRYGQRPVRAPEPHEALPPGVEGVDAEGRRYAGSGVAEPATVERAEEQVRQLQDATAARLEAASVAARETFDDARNRVSTGTSYVADTGRDAWAWARENPTAIGLAALAAGALAAGYYTASPPRRRPIPSDRALTVRDDYRDEYRGERVARSYRDERLRAESATMPVSAAAPAPMPPAMGVGTGMSRGMGTANAGGTVGGSGQIATPGSARDTVPATPRGGVQPVGGIASETSRDRTTASPTSGPTSAGTTSGATSGTSAAAGAAASLAAAGAAAAAARSTGSSTTGSSTTGSSTTGGSTTGPSAGSTPPGGAAAGEAARDPKRVPSGAGFGSTAASRGEVASKPSDGHAPKASERELSGAKTGGTTAGTTSATKDGPATSDAPARVGSSGTGTGGGDEASSSTVELTDVYPRS